MWDGTALDHWAETVNGSILEQYRDSTRWQACLKSVIDKLSALEADVSKIAFLIDFTNIKNADSPSGNRLDFISGLVNVVRESGESDESLFSKFLRRISSIAAGTPDNAIDLASIKSKDPTPQYMDEVPCTAFIYTPGGHQCTRKFMKSLGATGTLVLPGAAIQMADGSLLGDASEKLILAVADDANVEDPDTLIEFDDGSVLAGASGEVYTYG